MQASRFSDAQKAFILKQERTGFELVGGLRGKDVDRSAGGIAPLYLVNAMHNDNLCNTSGRKFRLCP